MFDTIVCIWWGFSGQLNKAPKARRLVWLLLLVFLSAWVATGFVVYVAKPTYHGLINSLPGSDVMAWVFSIIIALCIYFFSAYVMGYFVEIWMNVPEEERNYSPVGARIMGISLIVFGGVDLFMQTQGAVIHGENAAGEKVVYAYTDETLTNRMAENQAKIKAINTGKTGRGTYGWPDPDGQYRLNKKGQKEVARLEAEISKDADLDRMQREAAKAGVEQTNSRKDEIKGRLAGTLSYASYGVYIVLLLLCTIQSYTNEVIQRAKRALDKLKTLARGEISTPTPEVTQATPAAPAVVPGSQLFSPEQLAQLLQMLQLQQPGHSPVVAGYKIPTTQDTNGTNATPTGDARKYAVNCAHCGTEFKANTTRHIYCSDGCRQAAWAKNNPDKVGRHQRIIPNGTSTFT